MADLPFVGMDCVEVAPPYDHAELTSHAAAHVRLDLPLRAGGAPPASPLIRRKSLAGVDRRMAIIVRSTP
jgi:hypothetical protein